MDAVITYVNGLDPVWQAQYTQAMNVAPITKRYRDWGTLKYLFRGIEQHLSDVNNVFLVVSGESQVPEFVNRDRVKIVCHNDIIPQEYLPTFSSNTIEIFLHRIEGLSERFLYFNDDMFPVADMREDEFFTDNKIIFGYSKHLIINNLYKRSVFNSDRLVRRLLKKRHCLSFVRPQHTCTPMLKSESEKLFQSAGEEICKLITPVRKPENVSQFIYPDYLYFQNRVIRRRVSNKHISPSVHSAAKTAGYITDPVTKLVNINDVEMSAGDYEQFHKVIIDAFERHFPKKSVFEAL